MPGVQVGSFSSPNNECSKERLWINVAPIAAQIVSDGFALFGFELQRAAGNSRAGAERRAVEEHFDSRLDTTQNAE